MVNRKLAKLPNKVALASLVRRMPACQAARSAAKKIPPSATIATSAQPGKGRAAARARGDEGEEGDPQRQPPEARRDRPDVGEPNHPRPRRQEQVGEDQRGKGEAASRKAHRAGNCGAPRLGSSRQCRRSGSWTASSEKWTPQPSTGKVFKS